MNLSKCINFYFPWKRNLEPIIKFVQNVSRMLCFDFSPRIQDSGILNQGERFYYSWPDEVQDWYSNNIYWIYPSEHLPVQSQQ